jgi:hypothetical protein
VLAGFGISDSVGRGGALSLRLGRVATRRTVITIEADASVTLHTHGPGAPTKANNDTGVFAGAQYYASPWLSLRLGAGVGVYTERGLRPAGTMLPDERTTIGPAVLGGIGVDFARVKWAVFGVEASTWAIITSGVLLASSLKLGVAFD